MTIFKLKKEARQFFPKDLHEKAKPLEFWKKEFISELLLDKVDKVYIQYGIQKENMISLTGWSSNDGNPTARFDFTVHITDMTNDEYHDVEIVDVMDEIQKVLNKHFK